MLSADEIIKWYSLPGEELAGVEGCDGVLADLLGGDTYMTSALRGGGGNRKQDDSTNKLRDWDSDKGKWSKNPKI